MGDLFWNTKETENHLLLQKVKTGVVKAAQAVLSDEWNVLGLSYESPEERHGALGANDEFIDAWQAFAQDLNQMTMTPKVEGLGFFDTAAREAMVLWFLGHLKDIEHLPLRKEERDEDWNVFNLLPNNPQEEERARSVTKTIRNLWRRFLRKITSIDFDQVIEGKTIPLMK